MLFDSPEIKAMKEEDNQILEKGEIDWEPPILHIAKKIEECKDNLAIPDLTLEMSAELHPDFQIEKHKTDLAEQLAMARTELDKLIALISDKRVTDRIESLANDMKEWKEHELTIEEKERNDKIILK